MADWNNVRLEIGRKRVEVDEWVPKNRHLVSMFDKMEQEWWGLEREGKGQEFGSLEDEDQIKQQ